MVLNVCLITEQFKIRYQTEIECLWFVCFLNIFNILIVLTFCEISKEVNSCKSWEEVVFDVPHFSFHSEMMKNDTQICVKGHRSQF